MGPPASHGVPRVPCYSGTLAVTEGLRIRLQDFHLLWLDFPDHSTCAAFVTPYQCPQPRQASLSVWALSLSLAATNEVSFDFLSCSYLDVSVRCVSFTWPMHSAMDDRIWLPSPDGLPHSDILGLTVARHLPQAYRSLPRPSSPLDA